MANKVHSEGGYIHPRIRLLQIRQIFTPSLILIYSFLIHILIRTEKIKLGLLHE